MFNNAKLVIGAVAGIIIAFFIWSMVFSDKTDKIPTTSSDDSLMQLVPDESFLKKKGE